MPDRICPLRSDSKGVSLPCHPDCAWRIPDGDGKPMRCAVTWLPRLAEAVEGQTRLLQGVLAGGYPGFPEQAQ